MPDTRTRGPGGIAGEWVLGMQRLGQTEYARMNIGCDGGVAAVSTAGLKLEGTRRGSVLELQALEHGGLAARLTLEEREEGLAGECVIGEAQWSCTARRRPAPPTEPPRVLTFEPTEFHGLFSAAIPPALHIYPGDRVRTWTLDSSGFDAAGVQRSRGGNPQTGPFHIEGAFPGDTLAVTFTRMQLNRDTAVSRPRLAIDAATAAYFERRTLPQNPRNTWLLDRERGVARLARPTPSLRNFSVPLRPMLGCVGVAPPAGMALTSQCSGGFGGNMDYNRIRQGATVFLPVSHPGGLLFLGDGHAAQGDGEVTLSALETSMDVEFTTAVIPGRAWAMPRAEDDECVMAMGISRSLTEALQTATTEMARWLEEDYALDAEETASVLGTTLRYDVAEVVDPNVNVVARLSRQVLAKIAGPRATAGSQQP